MEMDSYLRSVVLLGERIEDLDHYPFSIPSIRSLQELKLHPRVTYFVGENGAGKSTLVEAIAIAAGLNPEGGSNNLRYKTRPSESELHQFLRLVRGVRRPRTSFFLRAESFFNVATQIDELGMTSSYGNRSLHEQSHGESFLSLITSRFGSDGLYILDEPEAALSPQRQLSLLAAMDRLSRVERCQFIVATHSPIVLAYPDSYIYSMSDEGIIKVEYEKTEQYRLVRDFLLNYKQYLHRLFRDVGGETM